VLARPGQRLAATCSKTAVIQARQRLRAEAAASLARAAPPAWCFVNMPMRDLSSSEIRARDGGA
jgi:nicotinate-nucleotide adenylyltransferase